MTERELAIAQYHLIQHFIDLAGVSKIRSTFIKAFLKAIKKDDGMHYLHGSFNQGGTVCTTRDTIFNTDIGPISLHKLSTQRKVLTKDGNYKAIAKITDIGLQPVYRVETKAGRNITTTGNHPFWIKDKWVNADELKPGDIVTVHGPAVEIWKTISNWNNYEISSIGRVRNKLTQRILVNQIKPPYGHLKVTLTKNVKNASRTSGTKKDKYIHVLVAKAFLPLSTNTEYEVTHINGIPWDNSVSNLEWKSSLSNSADSIKHGTAYKGDTTQAKLDWHKVYFIREQAQKLQLNNCEIANLLGVSRELVRDIKLNKRWVVKTFEAKVAVFNTDTISSISKLPSPRKMYGVSVLDTHSHVTNGILTHNSGRLSSSGPNLTNLPSNSEHADAVKQCFMPPPGFLWIGIDYNALEAMVDALVTQDPNKLKVYTEGFDSHCSNAYAYYKKQMPDIENTLESINSIADKYPLLRQSSKTITFALQYAGTKYALMQQCALSEKDASFIENAYHELYKVADTWKDNKLAGAARRGYITAAFGLRVRTPILKQILLGKRSTPYEGKAESRTAGNALTQSYGMLNMRSSIEFQQRLLESPYRYNIRLICQIHDSQYYLVKDCLGAIKWFNDNIVECIQWQKLKEIEHPTVKLGGSVEIFHPSWNEHFKIPNFATPKQILDAANEFIAQPEVDEHRQ